LQYIEDTVDKFDLRKHVHASVECLGAKWDGGNNQWSVQFRDLTTDIVFTRSATMLISAVGGISVPRGVSPLLKRSVITQELTAPLA
jgi:cation diffusion facilitator CzcD-associated flavoprotein CzcO